MLNDLPKIFTAKFLIGHFLPAVLFVTAAATTAAQMDLLEIQDAPFLSSTDPLLGIGIATIVAWLLGLLLLAANRPLMRIKEGYGLLNHRWNPLLAWQRHRFRTMQLQLNNLKDERELHRSQGGATLAKIQLKLNKTAQRLAENFPDQERYVLPTALGNAMRAFEVYPRLMYGAESTVLFNHLLAVVPEDFRLLMEEDRAQLNFWLNIWFLGWTFLFSYGALNLKDENLNFAPSVAALVAVLLASYWTRSSAVQWGAKVRTAFDLYLPDVARKAQLPQIDDREENRRLWQSYSHALLYRLPSSLPRARSANSSES